MSVHNYGASGYGFRCYSCEYEKVKAFIEKHLDEKMQRYFSNCKDIEEIEGVCSEVETLDGCFNGWSEASQILAYVMHEEVHKDIAFCHDDNDKDCILILPSLPWDHYDAKPTITKKEFEEKAGNLAFEFFGKDVSFDWQVTDEWC